MHRFLTWNICHGGGRRVRRILEEITSLRPDTIVLTEYRNGATGRALRSGLEALGWNAQIVSPTPDRVNGVLVASRHPLGVMLSGSLPVRWDCNRHLVVSNAWCTLSAVYLPPGPAKISAWKNLMSTARSLNNEQAILIGDFNTGKHFIDEVGATFIAPEYIDHLESLGFVDAWRALNPAAREYTWYSPAGNGFRLDYAFFSPKLAPSLHSAFHLHGHRLAGLSDHAGLLIDVDVGYARPCDAAASANLAELMPSSGGV